MRSPGRARLLLVLVGALGCAKPDSVALGGPCKEEVECKDPADTCMTLGAKSLCSMACSASTPCPDTFACAHMEVKIEGSGAGTSGRGGYCIAASELPPNAATIAPSRKGKRRKSTAQESR